MDKFLNLVISGSVTGAIYSIMAAGLVLTYQTSGIFNFAHGAVAFIGRVLLLPAEHRAGHPDRARRSSSRCSSSRRCSGCSSTASCCDASRPRRSTRDRRDDRSARRAAQPRAVAGRGVRQRRVSISDLPTLDTRRRGRRADPASARHPPTCSTSVARRRASTPTSSRCFIAAASSAVVLWCVLRRTRVGPRDARGRRPASLAGLRGVNAARTSAARVDALDDARRARRVLIAPLFQLDDILSRCVVLGSLAAVALGGLALDSRSRSSAGSLLGDRPEPPRRLQRRRSCPNSSPSSAGFRVLDPVHPHAAPPLPRCRARARAARRARRRRAGRRVRPPRRASRVAAAAAVGDLHRGLAGVLPPLVRRRCAAGRLVRAGPHRTRALRWRLIFLSFVVRHRHRRHGEPRPGDVRHRGRLHRRLGAEPRLGRRLPAGRDPRAAELPAGARCSPASSRLRSARWWRYRYAGSAR